VEGALKQDLEGIAKASGRAADLVRQILAFSRVLPEDPRPLDPRPLVDEALKLLRATLPAGVRMDSALGRTRPVLADPAEIHRVVVNLCSNASLAMGGNGVLKVALEDVEPDAALRDALPGLRPGPQVLLRVEDDGCGMAPEVLERIFDPFFTTRAAAGGHAGGGGGTRAQGGRGPGQRTPGHGAAGG
jgi:signal transduction histidine kinase